VVQGTEDPKNKGQSLPSHIGFGVRDSGHEYMSVGWANFFASRSSRFHKGKTLEPLWYTTKSPMFLLVVFFTTNTFFNFRDPCGIL